MTTKGLLLGAVLLILAIASTLTIFKLFEKKQEVEIESHTDSHSHSQSIQP
ncbi:MAG: hypothetical protein ACPGEE_02935 [Opitutales bacterium]|jgi:hypothetical protein